MKLTLIILIFLGLVVHYYIPSEIKNKSLEKLGLDSIISYEKVEENIDIKNNGIIELSFENNNKISYSGDIKNAKKYDMKWGAGNYVKCFLAGEEVNFSGNQVLHRILLEKNKTIDLELKTSTGASHELNLYLYKTTIGENLLPPDINRTHECKSNINPGNKKISMKANTIKSEIIIGVAGKTKETLNGKYELILNQK